jgi:hypothetical protein
MMPLGSNRIAIAVNDSGQIGRAGFHRPGDKC